MRFHHLLENNKRHPFEGSTNCHHLGMPRSFRHYWRRVLQALPNRYFLPNRFERFFQSQKKEISEKAIGGRSDLYDGLYSLTLPLIVSWLKLGLWDTRLVNEIFEYLVLILMPVIRSSSSLQHLNDNIRSATHSYQLKNAFGGKWWQHGKNIIQWTGVVYHNLR